MNNLLLKALRCENVPRPPVWLMRQAGRYMPQYRALRSQHSLWQMFHHPEIAADVTRMPVEHLGVDAAILFSDILVIAEALGLSVSFPDKGGPRVEPAIHTAEQVAALPYIPVEESLGYVYQTIALIKKSIDVPLIGFSGGPFTVASYFIDSSSANAFERTKSWIKEDPPSFHELLSKITHATIAHLKAQVRAGADVLQVFDSWANVLNDEEFALFCIPYLKQIVNAFKESSIPVILFCRSSSLRADTLAAVQPTAISFDWHLTMPELRKKVPSHIAVQGNFNPEFLKLPQEQIINGVRELLDSMQGERGFIVNLGHGVTPDIPVENVRCFVEAITQITQRR
jgi:uroporphyrinogen decarboxylase